MNHTFYCEVAIFQRLTNHSHMIAVEVPAATLEEAMRSLQAWAAGLSIHERFDRMYEQYVDRAKRRGTTYLTLREAAQQLGVLL